MKKTLAAYALAFMSAVTTFGCANVDEQGNPLDESNDESDDLGSTSQAVTDSWIGPFSEETGYNTGTCSQANRGITYGRCEGRYCDNISMYCAATPVATGGSFWTGYISEENGVGGVSCESGGSGSGINGIVDGVRIKGRYADNVSLHCRTVGSNHLRNCDWTPWFSEEQPAQYFNGKFAVGVRCSGSYCDSMSYRVCDLY